MKTQIVAFSLMFLAAGCSHYQEKSDAYGTFESTEVTVSAEGNGKIFRLTAEEGRMIDSGAVVGQIDTTDLYLKLKQLVAQKNFIATKPVNISSQIEVQKQQKENLLVEKARLDKLFRDGAATSKQIDDMRGSLSLADRQIAVLETQKNAVKDELDGVDRQIDQVKESIRKCRIVNPVKGTVLTRYAEAGEMTAAGKALYKIAGLDSMYLRVYVSGAQLPGIRLGQKVEVLVDKDAKTNRKLEGVVSWISPTAEFTPKIIQTKEERVTLVYAVKIRVKNDGTLKIAMPGEANFSGDKK